MKIKYFDIEELERIISSIPLKGEANLLFAENKIILGDYTKILTETKDRLVKQHSKGQNSITVTDPGWKDFLKDLNEIWEKEVIVEKKLNQIKKSDINFDKEVNQNDIFILLKYGLIH